MISIGNKGTLADSHIAKDTTKTQLSQHSWVYQATKELERLTAKLVSSNTELWTHAPYLAWILKHLHTQHREASPSLLHGPSGYAFPSSAILGVQRNLADKSRGWFVSLHTLNSTGREGIS